MASGIKSESKIVWNFILGILKMPFILVSAAFGKRNAGEAFQFLEDFIKAVLEPKFTILIILLNIIIFFASLFFPDALINSLLLYPSDITNFRLHTLITSGFLHANITHLLGNMLVLFIFGRIVEMELGPGKTGLVYFSSMVFAGVFSSLISLLILGSDVPALGASGAIMGMVATAIMLKPFSLAWEFGIPIPVFVLGWLAIAADVIGAFGKVQDGIGHFAHLGGFISIFLLIPFLNTENKSRMIKGIVVNVVTLACLLSIYFLFLNG